MATWSYAAEARAAAAEVCAAGILPANKKARLRRGSGRGKKRPPLDRGACVSHTAQKI